MFPALDKRGELFSLLIAECHDVLLNCVLFAGHESAPSLVTGTSIQRTRAESMTDTTRALPVTPSPRRRGRAAPAGPSGRVLSLRSYCDHQRELVGLLDRQISRFGPTQDLACQSRELPAVA